MTADDKLHIDEKWCMVCLYWETAQECEPCNMCLQLGEDLHPYWQLGGQFFDLDECELPE
jgi:hypothetical protein